EARDIEYFWTAATLLLGGVAFMLAYNFYVRRVWRPWSAAVPRLQRLLEHKYYFDEVYDAVFVRPMDAVGEGGDRYIEEPIIDGTPAEIGIAAQSSAAGLSLTQTGYFRTYALVFLAGAVVAAVILLLVRAAGGCWRLSCWVPSPGVGFLGC